MREITYGKKVGKITRNWRFRFKFQMPGVALIRFSQTFQYFQNVDTKYLYASQPTPLHSIPQTFIYLVTEWDDVHVKLMGLEESTFEFASAKQFSLCSMRMFDNENSLKMCRMEIDSSWRRLWKIISNFSVN